MQIPNINNKKLVTDTLQKVEAFLGLLYVLAFFLLLGLFAYFYSSNLLSLNKPAEPRKVSLSPEFETLKSKTGITFEGTDGIKKNIENLQDNTEHIVGGVKGRTNPFDSYAAPRPAR